jgi:hypothetical protein
MSSYERFEFIGQAGVQKAIEESRRLGVPNVYSIDGVLHWQLPNGELTTEDPYLKQQEQNQAGGTAEDA